MRVLIWFGLGLVVTAGLSGCKVRSAEHAAGEDVQVATPLGGLHVKTGESVQASVGLPIYPGAEAVKDSGDDKGAADVNLSFGRFQLRVRALRFRTGDDPDTVEAFYRKALARYGDVLECAGQRPVRTPARTSEGLTCDEGKGGRETGGDLSGDDLQLKSGSEHHQHIVGVEHEGKGTKFALVAVDLPEGLPGGGDASPSNGPAAAVP